MASLFLLSNLHAAVSLLAFQFQTQSNQFQTQQQQPTMASLFSSSKLSNPRAAVSSLAFQFQTQSSSIIQQELSLLVSSSNQFQTQQQQPI
jgi:hypothetical protein